MNRNFKRNLSFGFGISLLILLLSTVASYISINSLLNSSRQVTNTHSFIKELDNVIAILIDAETGQRGYLLTGETVFLDPYRGANGKATRALEKVQTLVTEIPDQQDNLDKLQVSVRERLRILEDLIEQKKAGKVISLADFKQGKDRMDEVRRIVNAMESNAQGALVQRTEKLSLFAIYTRLMIVVAYLIAVVITVVFYIRVKTDFDERSKLQLEMIEKDRDISHRIEMIHNIANKISSGDYKIRINNKDKDTLGSLAGSLNKMAASLEHSFGLLSEKEWLQTGIAELNERMMNGTDISKLCANALNYIMEYTNSQVGSFYILENDAKLNLYCVYGLASNASAKSLNLGEGLTGQCALDGKIKFLENISDDNIVIPLASGHIKPKNIIVFPLYNEGIIKGVIELFKVNEFSKNELAFLDAISQRVGGIINRLQNRLKMKELLEETQSQTEELHTQHTELQNLNADLEINTQKLQASEQVLKTQQQELLTANDELKERTYMLEEKNQMIQERNNEIQRKAEELALSTKYKSEFLANMSHELRTPLNSILLLSGLMINNNEDKLSEEHIEYAKVIQSSGNGLLSLIDEILDLSKVESGKIQLSYEDVSVKEMISSIELLFKPFAKQKDIQFSIITQPGVPENIETDRMRVDQVLKNLLSNAMKFTPVNGKVSFTISKENQFITFRVEDTGIGIAANKQDLIFEAFQQEDGSTRRKFGGTGLGLSISRELVKLLNGKISLTSEVGKGSIFTAYIPIVPATETETLNKILPVETILQDSYDEDHRIEVNEAGKIETVQLKERISDDREEINPGDKLIIIIEDDLYLAKMLLEYARTNGYKGIIALRGDEGLELVKKYNPSAILLDIQLPGKNGWEIMEDLKKDIRTMHTPVHMMSSYKVEQESILKGAEEFIHKPVEFEKIKSIFDKMDVNLDKGKKILIIEEDNKHAVALGYFLTTSEIRTKIVHDLEEGIKLLLAETMDCVILDTIDIVQDAYDGLDRIKIQEDVVSFPIVVLASKNLSKKEEQHLRKYVDSVFSRNTYSYQKILDEVSLFLHVVEKDKTPFHHVDQCKKLGILNDVLKHKTILIADDDVRNIFSLTKALEAYKVNVIAAMDGKEAIEKLEQYGSDVDLILMDMMMPELDGYDATMKIRENSKYKNLPVIAVTAKAMINDREKCIQAGASDYITKPVDVNQLLSLLRVWLYEGSLVKIN